MIRIALVVVVATALSAQAWPTLRSINQDRSLNIPFVNTDGSLDISSLFAAAAITPDKVPPPQVAHNFPKISLSDVREQVLDQVGDLLVRNAPHDLPDARSLFNEKRGNVSPTWQGYSVCGAQLPTSGPLVNTPDTPDAFRQSPALLQPAKTAATPLGFSLVYSGLNGVYQTPTANTYLGNMRLEVYDPSICADQCVNKTKNCQSFNIYYERNPSINMNGADLSKCNNPPSITRIGCQFFGVAITQAGATSTGQFRGNYFQTAKAGSNAYNLPYPLKALNGTKGPAFFPNGKVDNQVGAPNLVGVGLLTANPYFDPQFCVDAANTYWQSEWQSINTWQQLRDGVYVGQGCLVYKTKGLNNYNSSVANDAGQWGSVEANETNVWYASKPSLYYERL